MRAAAAAVDGAGGGGGGGSSSSFKARHLRDSIVERQETKERLSRKRPANEAPIDLTGDD